MLAANGEAGCVGGHAKFVRRGHFHRVYPPSPWSNGMMTLPRFCRQYLEAKGVRGMIWKAKELVFSFQFSVAPARLRLNGSRMNAG